MAQHGTDLTPTCDRCEQPMTQGGVVATDLGIAVCLGCMTDEERQRMLTGRDPFAKEES